MCAAHFVNKEPLAAGSSAYMTLYRGRWHQHDTMRASMTPLWPHPAGDLVNTAVILAGLTAVLIIGPKEEPNYTLQVPSAFRGPPALRSRPLQRGVYFPVRRCVLKPVPPPVLRGTRANCRIAARTQHPYTSLPRGGC